MHPDDREAREADFGFERVPWGEKRLRVRGVFDSVASRYDLMNDVMSAGLHRLWKRFTIAKTGLLAGQAALDVAAGSGDLAIGLAQRVGRAGRVVVTDINSKMLGVGRDRMLDAGQRRLRALRRGGAAVRDVFVPLRDDGFRAA
jgi:demethylmenaquinone methyltransferase/2-methoxy-6-polyprenyl-1,4-benzoquinol methylase